MNPKTLFEQFEPRLTVIRRFLPAIAFFCGFTWDSVTMGRVVSFFDLLVLTTYYFGAGLILVLLVREVKPQWNNWFNFLIQFFFGGLFSALVLKESYICKNFRKEDGVYQCQAEKQPFWRALGLGRDVIHFQEGEKIYSLNAVFAPTRITVDLEQRWWLRDEGSRSWLARGVINLPMVGGRKEGWRTYSYIHTGVQPGYWKVETALQSGAVLAVHYFTAKDQREPAPQTHTVKVY